MKKITLILITLFLFAACSPTKRLERILNRNPQLTAIDTITIHHETITPRIEFRERYITQPNDTIHIYQDKIEFKVIRQHDSIYIEIERPADTIRTEIKVPVEVIKYEKPNTWHMFWKRFPWLVILIILVFAYLYKK